MKEGLGSNWAEVVRQFWFGELTREDWFGGSSALDARIKERFEGLYGRIAAQVPPEAWNEAEAALAAVIVLDQFPRNMFRGTAAAFVTDPVASALARNAVEKELDQQLGEDERAFLYMPFMHSEILADQELGVALFRSLSAPESLRYAEEHRDIIARFGRFPHRNKVLGRESTPAELEFLKTADRYGQ